MLRPMSLLNIEALVNLVMDVNVVGNFLCAREAIKRIALLWRREELL